MKGFVLYPFFIFFRKEKTTKTDISEELEHWKTCPYCHEKGTMNAETADVVCTNPKCERFQSVVR